MPRIYRKCVNNSMKIENKKNDNKNVDMLVQSNKKERKRATTFHTLEVFFENLNRIKQII